MAGRRAPLRSEQSVGPSPKVCRSCGRVITWRRAWAQSWDSVRYCSAACRRRGVTADDRAAEQVIHRLMPAGNGRLALDEAEVAFTAERHDEVARSTGLPVREVVRRAARRLVAAGEVEFVQQGRVVDPSTAKGPVQLRRTR